MEDLIIGLKRSLAIWKNKEYSKNSEWHIANYKKKEENIRQIENLLLEYKNNNETFSREQITNAIRIIERSNKRAGVKNEQNHY